jgi:hypothetical protein
MRECDEIRGLLAGLVYDELPAGEKPRVEAHLPGCAECRAELASMREASSALDAWSLAPVRRKKATRRRVAPRGRKPAVAAAWIAAAALFLLALALPFFTRSVDPAPAPITKIPVAPAAPLPPEREKARNEAQEELARIEADRKKARERLESIEREWEQLLLDKKKEAADAQRQQARMQEERQKVEADLDRSQVAREKAQEKLVRAETPGTVAVVAMIDWAQGDVRVVTPAGKVPATPAKALVSGHGLETAGPDSVVVVKFPDSTRLELLGPATVRAISDGEEGKRVDLVAGAIKADVARQPAGKPMVFRTADAEVRVVGTRFRLVSQATTRIDLHEGKVRLTRLKDDASVEVAAGSTATTAGARLYPRPLREVSFQDGVSPAPTYAGTRDSFLSETNAAHNYGTNPTLQVDGDNPGGTGRELRMVLRWDVAPIPPGSRIQSAALVLHRSARSEPPYTVHAIRRAWNETDVSWQTLSGDRLPPALGFAIPVEEQFVFPLNADGIALVQSWVDAPAGNNGVLLIAPRNSSGMKAHSRESTEAAKRPKLVVTYTPR